MGAKICIVIMGPTLKEAKRQILHAVAFADILELRLDHIDFINLEDIRVLVQLTNLPVVFTFKRSGQLQEESYCQTIKDLVILGPQYVDLEYDLPSEFFDEIKSLAPKVKIICSYHDFERTPANLDKVYSEIKQKKADIYKLAVMANSILDSIKMLEWLKKHSYQQIIGVSMGELGQITRILSPLYGGLWTYASLEDGLASAPGQLNARILLKFYHYRQLNSQTKVFGLIGDPISQSPSHYTHNTVLRELGVNAVYVKFRVKPKELDDFIAGARRLDWSGFSVTIPHKEGVMKHVTDLNEESKKIGAINTLLLTENGIRGINSDCMGALDVLERKIQVKDKKIVLLGAGGSAKAIAFEARKRGAQLVILNRTTSRAKTLATQVKASYGNLVQFSEYAEKGYDVLINSTSVGKEGEQTPVLSETLLPEKVVMDIIITPKVTPLLKAAAQKKCISVYGLEMFLQQATWQFVFWLGDEIKREQVEKTLERAITEWQGMQ